MIELATGRRADQGQRSSNPNSPLGIPGIPTRLDGALITENHTLKSGREYPEYPGRHDTREQPANMWSFFVADIGATSGAGKAGGAIRR